MSFVTPANLVNFLESLTVNELEVIAKRSIYHPNKFYKIVLNHLPDGSISRLHIWKSKESSENANDSFNKQYPHDHSWDFKSYIVAGELTDIHYQELHNDDLYGTKINDSTKMSSNVCVKTRKMRCLKDMSIEQHGKYGYLFDHDCKLVEVQRYQRKVGSSYELKHDTIHTSHPTKGTITLVHQAPFIQFKQNTIYVPIDLPIIMTKDNLRYYDTMTVDMLKILIAETIATVTTVATITTDADIETIK